MSLITHNITAKLTNQYTPTGRIPLDWLRCINWLWWRPPHMTILRTILMTILTWNIRLHDHMFPSSSSHLLHNWESLAKEFWRLHLQLDFRLTFKILSPLVMIFKHLDYCFSALNHIDAKFHFAIGYGCCSYYFLLLFHYLQTENKLHKENR